MSHLDRPTDFYHQRFAVIQFWSRWPIGARSVRGLERKDHD
nr:MAG TPA: hypothetical protein [Caudoviricetes sp.]